MQWGKSCTTGHSLWLTEATGTMVCWVHLSFSVLYTHELLMASRPVSLPKHHLEYAPYNIHLTLLHMQSLVKPTACYWSSLSISHLSILNASMHVLYILCSLVRNCANSYCPWYIEIVLKRSDLSSGDARGAARNQSYKGHICLAPHFKPDVVVVK